LDLDIPQLLSRYLTLLFSLCAHEAAHAWMANRCGDPSARLMGRLTLDPMKHIDPIGTVVMPIIMMVSSYPMLFGWAKPVPFNPINLRNIRRDPVLIAIAGPASNLIIAILCAFLLRIIIMVDGVAPGIAILGTLVTIVFDLIAINLVLILFNLIPVPPLDGHYVLHYFLPPEAQKMFEKIGPFGIIIAIMVAQPWLSVSMPYMQSMIFWVATVGLG